MKMKTYFQLLGGVVVLLTLWYLWSIINPAMKPWIPLLASTFGWASIFFISIVVVTALAMGSLLFMFVMQKIQLMKKEERFTLLQVSENNTYPALFDVRRNVLIQPTNGELPVRVVPNSYAPHYSISQDSNDAELMKTLQFIIKQNRTTDGALAIPEHSGSNNLLPGPCDLLDLLNDGFIPDTKNIFLGYKQGGEEIFSELEDLCHVANAGATGGGKTSLLRMISSQIVSERVGAQAILLNPHHTSYDPKTGEDWSPIERHLTRSPMVEYNDIGRWMRWAAESELPKRLNLFRQSKPYGDPLFIIIDELPAIANKIPEFAGWMAMILREGRKVGIFLIASSQDFLVKTLKMESGAVRDCYRTAMYVGGDPTTARVLLDTKGTIDDGTLGKGIILLRTNKIKTASRVRVPFTSNEALYSLLGPSRFSQDQIDEMKRAYRENRVITEDRPALSSEDLFSDQSEEYLAQIPELDIPSKRIVQLPTWKQVWTDFANESKRPTKREIMKKYGITDHAAYKILKEIEETERRSGGWVVENA